MNKIIKALAILLPAFLFSFTFAGCTAKGTGSSKTLTSDFTNETQVMTEKIKATNIYLSNKALTLAVGDTYMLVPTILPANATETSVNWASNNVKIVSVEDGKVTAKAIGTAKITAKTSNGKTTVCTVKVEKKIIEPYYISLNEKMITLNVGDSYNLVASIIPSNASDKTIIWTSSNSIIAIVNNGKITAVSSGDATITASTSNHLQTTCMVRVDDTDIKPDLVGLSATNIHLKAGESFNLVASIIPANATETTITWKSGNNNIATVSDGTVTAHSPGTTTITAKTVNGRTADCVITVSK